jgi:3-methyladenine DNA glycosylase/8-oxoguanine DNA glycosylase
VQERLIATPFRIDLARTLGPLCRGAADPTMRVGGGEAWGPGDRWALDTVPGLVGALDDAERFEPHDDVIAELWRHHRGVRITRSGGVMQVLIPTILEQKVTGIEARRAYRAMVLATSEPAPGPSGLFLPPDPARLAETPYFAFHPWGVERRRAETVRNACAHAARLEAGTALTLEQAKARMGALPGIGPWTVAEVARMALGDADAVSVGDFHLSNTVCWALAGEPRGTDERMLELLEPYRGQRGRVQLLLDAGNISAPKYGPRMEPGAIERL